MSHTQAIGFALLITGAGQMTGLIAHYGGARAESGGAPYSLWIGPVAFCLIGFAFVAFG